MTARSFLNLLGAQIPDTEKLVDHRMKRLATLSHISAEDIRKLAHIREDVSVTAMLALTGIHESVASLSEKGVYTAAEAYQLKRAARVETIVNLSFPDRAETTPQAVMAKIAELDQAYANGEMDRSEYDRQRAEIFETLTAKLDKTAEGWRHMYDLHPENHDSRPEGYEFMDVPGLRPNNMEWFVAYMDFVRTRDPQTFQTIVVQATQVYERLGKKEADLGRKNRHGKIALLIPQDILYARTLGYMLLNSSFHDLLLRLEEENMKYIPERNETHPLCDQAQRGKIIAQEEDEQKIRTAVLMAGLNVFKQEEA